MLALGLGSVFTQLAVADPRVDSWLTTYSGKYARIYATTADQTSGNAVATWSRNSLSQSSPAYSGVQEIYSSANWTYIRTTGLGAHVMGPWYLNAGKTMLFPNVPVNRKIFYRIPRNPTVPGTKTLTGLGAIGYFVDGVAMFDSRDAFYWNGTSEVQGNGNWNRDAYVNEGVTFDPANAHQENQGTYHYHANPIALRHLMGDHVSFNHATKTYSENPTNIHHSPILGWVRDGYPIYGPYGYSNATNAGSGVRRIISGYVLRNGQNGTDNLTTTGRTSLPAWAVRRYGTMTTSGPNVSATYPLGRYMEDNAYRGDLGQTLGIEFDLDEFNGRFCVTPEFPGGIYGYFVCIASNGTPVFPYNIGRAFYGSPTGNTVGSLVESVTTNFVGGTNMPMELSAPILNPANNTVTLVWSAVEGGTYVVESKTNLANAWNTQASNIVGQNISAQVITNRSGDIEFYQTRRTAVAPFDPVK
jgi:hypothetical protein